MTAARDSLFKLSPKNSCSLYHQSCSLGYSQTTVFLLVFSFIHHFNKRQEMSCRIKAGNGAWTTEVEC